MALPVESVRMSFAPVFFHKNFQVVFRALCRSSLFAGRVHQADTGISPFSIAPDQASGYAFRHALPEVVVHTGRAQVGRRRFQSLPNLDLPELESPER